ncbi:MAG: thiamine pyrophosphate-dependent enzyme [Proteobacteria bacterium]|nr:thiamine pyrophosphate-dependent enzyme [Pseudomonadota bacterium]
MTEFTLDRRDILPRLLPDPDKYLIVTGLAGAAKDTADYTKEAANAITLGGAMGAAVSMGLGVALSAPHEEVMVITGDGELMMSVGSLATVASMMPGNLSIVCVDNGCHGETGGQPGHTSRRTNLALMAEGAGIPSTLTVETTDQLDAAAKFLVEAPAPRFLWVRVMPGPSSDYKRNWNLVEGRLKFRNAYLARKKQS